MSYGIAVLAGTPVDTRMGLDCLARAGIPGGLAVPLAQDPREQTSFQISAPEERQRRCRELIRGAMAQGCDRAFVYCNSLAAAVDFSLLAVDLGLRIVTPLDVYSRLAGRYRRLGVLAANGQGLAGIERALLSSNPSLDLLGACSLSTVLAVESGENPAALVERNRLPALAEWFAACGMEALLLGCTHFPYYKDALAARTSLPLIDPADEMLSLLLA